MMPSSRKDRLKNLASAMGKAVNIAMADFDESKHPRDDHGRFGEGGGGKRVGKQEALVQHTKDQNVKLKPDARAKMVSALIQSTLDAQGDETFEDNIALLKGMKSPEWKDIKDGEDQGEALEAIERALKSSYAKESDANIKAEHDEMRGEDSKGGESKAEKQANQIFKEKILSNKNAIFKEMKALYPKYKVEDHKDWDKAVDFLMKKAGAKGLPPAVHDELLTNVLIVL